MFVCHIGLFHCFLRLSQCNTALYLLDFHIYCQCTDSKAALSPFLYFKISQTFRNSHLYEKCQKLLWLLEMAALEAPTQSERTIRQGLSCALGLWLLVLQDAYFNDGNASTVRNKLAVKFLLIVLLAIFKMVLKIVEYVLSKCVATLLVPDSLYSFPLSTSPPPSPQLLFLVVCSTRSVELLM